MRPEGAEYTPLADDPEVYDFKRDMEMTEWRWSEHEKDLRREIRKARGPRRRRKHDRIEACNVTSAKVVFPTGPG